MSTTWINRGHLYAPHVTPVIADCRFTVTPTNGLGITALKGQAAQNVFMHTSTTPSAGPNGLINPNPAAGIIMVQLADNFTQLYGVTATITSPLSGSSLNVDLSDAALTVGALYVITALGTTTAADWKALGVPSGVAAAVGVSFVALAVGVGVGTGTVQAPAAAGSAIDHVELVGSPTLMLGPTPVGGSPNVGAWVMLRTMAKTVTAGAYTPAGTISRGNIPVATGTAGDAVTNNAGTLNSTGGQDLTVDLQTFTGSAASLTATSADVQAAPATGTIIRLALYLNQSSVLIAGE